MATARQRGRGYEIRVSMGYDMTGKKIVKSKTWIPPKSLTPKQLEKELERQKILFEEEVKTGSYPNGNMKFQPYSEKWLIEYGQQYLAPKTYSRYCDYLKRINKAIGHIKLKDLSPLHLNAFYRNLAEDGVNKRAKRDEKGNIIRNGRLSPKTIVDITGLFQKCCLLRLSGILLLTMLQDDQTHRRYRERILSFSMRKKQKVF